VTSGANVRVGINLLWLAPGEVGGSEDYCIGLLRALARARASANGVDLVVYLNRSVDEAYPDLRRSFQARVAPVSGRSRAARVAAEHTWLVRASRRDRVDLVHHMGGTMPFLRAVPGIVLVHDLQAWACPENFSVGKRAYLRATVPRSVRAARAVTTLSRWVQDDINRRLGVPRSRMRCVPPGRERLAGTDARTESDEVVLERFGLVDRPFLLYPAITYPHKNHVVLLDAFARVATEDPDVVLVLTGGESSQEQRVRDLIARARLQTRVRRLGRVTNTELGALYRTTTALTFPSRYEGFGMPVLEVMGVGRPVIASDAGALPEVVGDGGLLLDPDDTEAWFGAIRTVLVDADRRRELSVAAANRAAAFSWDRSVHELLSLYRREGRVADEDSVTS
jgi:alpha-1,3-rhamnosyl/mannosyltransferase